MFNIERFSNGQLKLMSITKGDTAKFTVDIVTPNTFQPHMLSTGDSCIFYIRRFYSDVTPLVSINGVFSPNTSTVHFEIDPSNTLNLQLDDYLCGVVLTTVNGEVHSIITPSCDKNNRYFNNFRLCGELA